MMYSAFFLSFSEKYSRFGLKEAENDKIWGETDAPLKLKY